MHGTEQDALNTGTKLEAGNNTCVASTALLAAAQAQAQSQHLVISRAARTRMQQALLRPAKNKLRVSNQQQGFSLHSSTTSLTMAARFTLRNAAAAA
jgi:hypothetical protein